MDQVWRLLKTGAKEGCFNMALDEVLARLVASGSAPPTLRLYRFAPPAVSIGYFQRWDELDLEVCSRLGIDLVRRPTGGKAVLHEWDLTYAFALPLESPWAAGSVVESYVRISQGFLLGLKALGVDASLVPQAPAPPSALCFLSPTPYELQVQGKKLMGSAQRRFKGSLLQHGSLLLEFHPERLRAILHSDRFHDKALLERIGSLREILGEVPSWQSLEAAIIGGVEEALKVRLSEGALQEEERRLAEKLAQERSSSQFWSRRAISEDLF